jgi:hypothetical protein
MPSCLHLPLLRSSRFSCAALQRPLVGADSAAGSCCSPEVLAWLPWYGCCHSGFCPFLLLTLRNSAAAVPMQRPSGFERPNPLSGLTCPAAWKPEQTNVHAPPSSVMHRCPRCDFFVSVVPSLVHSTLRAWLGKQWPNMLAEACPTEESCCTAVFSNPSSEVIDDRICTPDG